MSLSDAVRRWTPVAERLKARLARKSGSMPPPIEEAARETLFACESMLQDLATAEIEYARLSRELQRQAGEWAQLFEEMPVACVVTDSAGNVIQGNRAAADLLNLSARHLENRLLTYFVQDRDEFLKTLSRLAPAGGQVRATFTLRPRERAPFTIEVVAVPRTPNDATVWLWFLIPKTSYASARDKGKAPRQLSD